MKKITRMVLFILLITFISCESLQYPVTGDLSFVSLCKNQDIFPEGYVRTPDTLSCVEYSYDAETETLSLTHKNAGFNCCPGNITCKISTSNDTILIAENEEQAICNCNCLRELDFGLKNVVNGKYIIKFIEPYAGDLKQLIFKIDLKKNSEGEFCVTRKSYPWM